jgi:hypothetical protein
MMRQRPAERSARAAGFLVAAVAALFGWAAQAAAGERPAVKHPNLLLNREEIEQVKEKIKRHEWAARLFERVKGLANDQGRTGRIPREAALVYALTGDRRYADMARRALVGNSRYHLAQYEKLDLKHDPDFGAWGPWATWAWAYDLTYDTFSEEERQVVERLLRTAARTIIEGLKLRPTTPNLVFEKHWKVGLIGYCLGDQELIRWGLSDPGHHGPYLGGFYPVLDAMIKDGHFWGEAPIYALHYDLHGMLALAEAARHYDGTDLYHYVSKKSGGSIKNLLDGYLRMAYPLEKTGIHGGSVRMATFGDGSTVYTPRGELVDTFLVNPVSRAVGEVTLSGELEIAYKRYKDPGYAWLLSLNPKREQYIGSPGQGGMRPVWGYIALTHGEPLPEKLTPPPAPGAVYPSQGFVMLRSDESPRYWTSGATAAVLRLGALVGHGHKDYFHLILHGKGRLLYPDLNIIQYEPTSINWTHEGIAHNTLLVDRQSPRPGPFTTRHDFSPEAKFFAITGAAFKGVTQTRALVLTPDYLADVFRAADTRGRQRTFDWVLHGLGRLYPGNPAAYRPTQALLPHYWWVDNERGRPADVTWQADWVQKSAGVMPGLQPLGKDWFDQAVGVRLTMLGVKGTEVYTGDGPIADGPPYHRLDGNPEGSSPLVVARRQAAATTFAAVHEPYDRHPSVRRVRRLHESEDAVGMAVEGAAFSDRVLVAFRGGEDRTLHAPDGEAFAFRDHGYVRVTRDAVTVRGPVKALRVRVPPSDKPALTVNGKEQPARRDGDFLAFGELPRGAEARPPADAPAERQAAVHYSFLPEEVHLRAGGAGETAMHLRCVGAGEARGRLRLTAPKGMTAEPDSVDVAGMKEGAEKVVRVRVKSAADTAGGLYAVRVAPDEEGVAAAGSLPVSVGVVMTTDNRVPLAAQTVVRAPGYTMKVDHVGGVSYALLDADGHRRHGYLHNTNFCFGLPAVERDGKWAFRYRYPCRFVWEGKNTLTVGSGADHDNARLRYTFHEDRVALSLIPPTDPRLEYTMWLGNFDALGPARHGGAQKAPHEPVVADWLFFPHPVHRQGVLLLLPTKTPLSARGTSVSFPLRAGREVSLRFATEEEVPALVKEKR